MPDFDLTPVDHDPFDASDVALGVPVDQRKGRLVINPGSEEAASMTHAAPMQSQPYMHPNVPAAARTIANFAQGGLQGAGVPMPSWMANNPVQEALQNPDNTAAMGMAIPLGGKPAGLSDVLPRGQSAMATDRPIHPDVLAAMHGEQTAGPAPALGGRDIHPDVLAAMQAEQEQSPPLARSVAGSALQQAGGNPERAAEILRGQAARTDSAPMKELYNQASSIVAYHGSPHDFDKFDISKIGTGEGAQAYGHGLYFAENPQVAGEYRDALSKLTWKLKENSRSPENEAMIQDVVERGATPEQAISTLKGEVRAHFNHAQELQTRTDLSPQGRDKQIAYAQNKALEAQNALDWLIEHKGDISSGKMYQVAIKADPEHFLDWDKPLSEQPNLEEKVLPLLNSDERFRYENLKKYAAESMPSVGTSTMNMLERSLGKEKTAEALRQAGIPGIRYLDQGSRNVGQEPYWKIIRGSDNSTVRELTSKSKAQAALTELGGDFRLEGPFDERSRNYVVFSDKIVDILKKYGLAGLVASGAYHYQDGDQ